MTVGQKHHPYVIEIGGIRTGFSECGQCGMPSLITVSNIYSLVTISAFAVQFDYSIPNKRLYQQVESSSHVAFLLNRGFDDAVMFL